MIKPFYQDSQITEYHGHTPDVLKELPAESVHMVVTSVPYWGLRDYGLEPQVWDAFGIVCPDCLGSGYEGGKGRDQCLSCKGEGRYRCEHEWGEENIRKVQSQKDNSGGLVDNRIDSRGKQSWTEGSSFEASQGQFCQKCNAWRGSLGLEPDPGLYISHIVQIFREVRRVLRKDGTCWLNIGDSYAANRSYQVKDTKGTDNTGNTMAASIPPGLKPKDLCIIPTRVALALQADGWWLRSDIIWAKPNPMPESCTDRPTNSYEHVFLLAKSQKYFYDADAVREGDQIYTRKAGGYKEHHNQMIDDYSPFKGKGGFADSDITTVGRNLRNVWTIATEPTPEAHFATFPSKLCEIAIKAGTSEKGCCPECGAPWTRITERKVKPHPNRWSKKPDAPGNYEMDTGSYQNKGTSDSLGMAIESKTIGWKPSCSCLSDDTYGQTYQNPGGEGGIPFDPIPCTVLDPFSGSGKALIVAKKLGRKAIGIDLKIEYLKMPLRKLAQKRLI